ncbi:hypothetical protein N0V91_004962 [Didymella pomorum]|uniref:Uncharacterized protein n=1 Tax=Didymella pomorum TaxID=749634 RepID=A0A9W9D8V1_9PLEO|nr:hypothetical protein N0V91_004962 [Didymella pomorum]
MSPGVDPLSHGPQCRPQHNILISIPRTASNLVTHLLALPAQPSVLAHPRDGYFFLPALSARFKHSTFTRPLPSWSPEESDSLGDALCQSASALETWVMDGDKQEKGTYVKEHANWMLKPSVESAFLHPDSATTTVPNNVEWSHTPENPTIVPDAFWPRVRATFLVRHPALTFPSTLRTALSNEGLEAVLGEESEKMMQWECTYKWHILLYRFLTSLTLGTGQKPLIIDASQLRGQDFVRKYAEEVGLDADLVRTSWDAVEEGEQGKMHEIERRMKDTLLASNGVIASKLSSRNIDVEAEKRKWETEFGMALVQRLERLVERAMDEYQWLYERRWHP